MIVAALVLLSVGAAAGAATSRFSDVDDDYWATEAIEWAADNQIVSGKNDGTFDPTGTVTRAQLAAILYRYWQRFGENPVGAMSFAEYDGLVKAVAAAVEVPSHSHQQQASGNRSCWLVSSIRGEGAFPFTTDGAATSSSVFGESSHVHTVPVDPFFGKGLVDVLEVACDG